MKPKSIFISVFCLSVIWAVAFQACNKDDEENTAPSCQISSPTDGEECDQGDLITITVNAADSDGSISEVRFYVDGINIGSVNNSPYKYDWDTSNESIGDHVLKATSVDNDGASQSDEVTIKVNEGARTDFTASPTSGIVPLTVNFTDQSTNNPTSWDWDFGDGNSSTEQSPTHTYNDLGIYDVTLTTNGSGTASETKSNLIKAKGTFTDTRDDQIYSFITIGEQTWFAENLNYETDDSWWYNNSPDDGDIYGRLYTWDAAQTACPAGWHLPNDEEWKALEMYLGMSQAEADKTEQRGTDQGKRLKSTSGWLSDGNGTDEVGFTALPGGERTNYETFGLKGSFAVWWTSDDGTGGSWGLYRFIDSDADKIGRKYYVKEFGYSIRCIKD